MSFWNFEQNLCVIACRYLQVYTMTYSFLWHEWIVFRVGWGPFISGCVCGLHHVCTVTYSCVWLTHPPVVSSEIFLYIYIHTYIHTYTHTHKYTHIDRYKQTCKYTYEHTYNHSSGLNPVDWIYMFVFSVCMYLHIHKQIFVSIGSSDTQS